MLLSKWWSLPSFKSSHSFSVWFTNLQSLHYIYAHICVTYAHICLISWVKLIWFYNRYKYIFTIDITQTVCQHFLSTEETKKQNQIKIPVQWSQDSSNSKHCWPPLMLTKQIRGQMNNLKIAIYTTNCSWDWEILTYIIGSVGTVSVSIIWRFNKTQG